MIALIRYSDDHDNAPTTSLFRRAHPPAALRTRGSRLRDFAAGLVDAGQGAGGGSGRGPDRPKRPRGPAHHVWRRSVGARARDPARGRRTGGCRAGVAGSAVRPAAHRHDPDYCPLSLAHGRPQRLDIQVHEALTTKLIQELAEGRIDTAIVALPVSERSLTEVPLFAENFLLVRPGHDAGKPVPDSRMLREMKLLLLEEGHCFRDQALSFCKMQSSLPREVLDASSLSTLVQMVSAGMGVTLIPEMAVPVETRSGSVSVARFKDPQPARTIGMIWRKTSPLAKQLRQLSDVVRGSAEAGSHAPRTQAPRGQQNGGVRSSGSERHAGRQHPKRRAPRRRRKP